MDDDDDFGADPDFLSALASSAGTAALPKPSQSRVQQPTPQRMQQPTPQRIQQPTPQRLDKAPPPQPAAAAAGAGPPVVQPTPQALPQRSSGSTILVSPRQKGNPVLASLRSVPWEYSDIPADYGLGLTTCALFLSLKYHRLHPEYIYTRIRNLQGKYNLRIVLTMVDIPNHEDSLRELSKTSLVNNVTIILCWSAAEAARYLELYKSYEHASFSGIKGQQATSYTERLVEFVTVPRGVNKSDAVSLVSAFGSIRNAVNADPEQVAVIGGWGEKKVKKWCGVVEEPFRAPAAKGQPHRAEGSNNVLDQAIPLSRVPLRDMPSLAAATGQKDKSSQSKPGQFHIWEPDDEEDEEAMVAAAVEESKKSVATEQPPSRQQESDLSDGVAAALAKLREK